MNQRKCLRITLFIIPFILLLQLLQSCSLFAENPNIMDSVSENRSQYAEKLDSFIQATNGFIHENSISGFEVDTIFNEVTAMFMQVLIKKESIENLESDTITGIDEQTGYYVEVSDSLRMNDYTYRLVKLANTYSENNMGAFDSLFIQYWTTDNVGCSLLVEACTNTAEIRSIADYRFYNDDKAVLIILKEHDNFEKFDDSYILFSFLLNEDQFESIDMETRYYLNNGNWEINTEDYSFHHDNRIVRGLHISELSEEGNAGKTSTDISNNRLQVFNNDVPESRIEIEFKDGIWQLTE